MNAEQREHARAILGALGEEIIVKDEYYIETATTLCGTGSAHLFLFMAALIGAGVHLGFPRHMAERHVLQTVKGSVE